MRPGIAARNVLLDADDAINAVTLADGTHVPMRCAGHRRWRDADIALAKRAGLATDRGVVVSEMLNPLGWRGFRHWRLRPAARAAPAWSRRGGVRARQLVARLTGSAPAPDAAADDIVRLKAPASTS